MKILNIVGARPNFMKVAPLHRTFSSDNRIDSKIIHTGQHFDAAMSEIFFNQLELPTPHYFLGVGSGTHSEVTARIMTSFESVLLEEKPDLVLVVGDVTSTLACSLVAVRNNIPVAHVEAGLRSYDRAMPEEVNRVLTDQISDLLFITEKSAIENLEKENISKSKIHFVGNCMIDSLVYYLPKADQSDILSHLHLFNKDYIVMTMHRPSNVDTNDGLLQIIQLVERATENTKVVFPIHPRTKNKLMQFGLLDSLEKNSNLIITEPLGYIEFIALLKNSKAVLTDSGGIQEETTFLKVPCLTFRSSTERPITVEVGTNILMNELNTDITMEQLKLILSGKVKVGHIPELWDGQAAQRIKGILVSKFLNS